MLSHKYGEMLITLTYKQYDKLKHEIDELHAEVAELREALVIVSESNHVSTYIYEVSQKALEDK